MYNLFISSSSGTTESQLSEEDVAAFLAAPMYTENQVGLISEGATSQVQEQATNHVPFYQLLNESSPMRQGLGISNEYNASRQVLDPSITGNNTLSGINHQASIHPFLNQIYPVEERARIDIGIPNGPIMTGERSTLLHLQNSRAINSHEAWNSRWPQQLSAVGVTDSQYNLNYLQYTQIYNLNNNYQFQGALPNGRWEQVTGPVQFSRPDQPIRILTNQVAAANENRVTTQRGRAIVPESASARLKQPIGIPPNQAAPTNATRVTTQLEKALAPEFACARTPLNSILNISNQNAPPMVSSAGSPSAIIPQQVGRELRREEPNEVARNVRAREGRAVLPWEGRRLEAGEGSSSKRQKTGSPPREGPNTGLTPPPQQPNNAPENRRLQDLINNIPAYRRRYMSNSLYDPVFESLGLALDPHIRLFEAQTARLEKGYYMFD